MPAMQSQIFLPVFIIWTVLINNDNRVDNLLTPAKLWKKTLLSTSETNYWKILDKLSNKKYRHRWNRLSGTPTLWWVQHLTLKIEDWRTILRIRGGSGVRWKGRSRRHRHSCGHRSQTQRAHRRPIVTARRPPHQYLSSWRSLSERFDVDSGLKKHCRACHSKLESTHGNVFISLISYLPPKNEPGLRGCFAAFRLADLIGVLLTRFR